MSRIKVFGELSRRQAIAFVGALKSSTPCMDCGGMFPSEAMDFDHARGVKVKGIAAMVARDFGLDEIQAEIEKCDIVCSNCHRIRTHMRAAQRRNK
jgi:hypothetical protein